MKTIALWIIAMVFLIQFLSTPDNKGINRLKDEAFKMCGGAEKTQALWFGGFWGGFGFQCMPR